MFENKVSKFAAAKQRLDSIPFVLENYPDSAAFED